MQHQRIHPLHHFACLTSGRRFEMIALFIVTAQDLQYVSPSSGLVLKTSVLAANVKPVSLCSAV